VTRTEPRPPPAGVLAATGATVRARPASLRQIAYLGLKSVNLLLATAISFALTGVLIRVLPLSAYSSFVVIAAMGSYVLAADLGFSSVVYNQLRRAFLRGEASSERSLAFTAFGLYLLVAIIAEAVMAAVLLFSDLGGPLRLALGGYFLSLVLALPWNLVRGIATATDRYLRYEAVEAVRRLLLTALVFALPHGLSLAGYALISVGLWAAAYALLLPSLMNQLGGPSLRGAWDPGRALGAHGRQMGAASVFSIMEFCVYNFPYVAVPLIYGKGLGLIAFDVFFKITRFGAFSYLVPNESLLPANTRAIHDRDGRRLVRNIALGLGLSAASCVVAVLAVTWFGDSVFRLLLKDASRVPVSVRWCMAGVLVAMMFQAASGTLLLNSGKVVALARVSVLMGSSMALMSVLAALGHWPFQTFMIAYVAVFSCGAAIYVSLLVRSVRRILGPEAAW